MRFLYNYHYLVLILHTCYRVLDADEQFETNKFLFKGGESNVYLYPKPCLEILNTFAMYASNFTHCSIINARPIRVCTNCIETYVNFHAKYKELQDTIVNGTSCLSLFVSQDRLDAILDYHNHILAIWDKGHCNDCFDWTEQAPRLSNSTKLFNKMFNETMACINNNINPYLNNSDEVCVKCMQPYIKLDDFYKTLSKDSIGVDSVCMDVVDSMNTTRAIWSKTLNCCSLRRTPEVIFLCCTAIIAIFPLLFYIAVRYCGPIRDLPNVLKESRFKQSILRNQD